MAAVTRPLIRAKFNFSPDVVRLDQGITNHTYLEVGTATPDFSPVFCSVLAYSLQPFVQSERPTVVWATRQLNNWPIVFFGMYRHIPPKSGDSDPSA